MAYYDINLNLEFHVKPHILQVASWTKRQLQKIL